MKPRAFELEARGVLPLRGWLARIACFVLGAATYAGALALDAQGRHLFPREHSTPLGVGLAALAIAIALLAPLVLPRAPEGRVLVRARPGAVTLRRAGRPWSRRIIASTRVEGVSLASTPRGTASLMIQVKGVNRPITLELASVADARAIERALGVGHGGFGQVRLPVTRASADVVSNMIRLPLACMSVLVLVISNRHADGLFALAGLGLPLACVRIALWASRTQRDERVVAMNAAGLAVPAADRSTTRLEFRDVRGARAAGRELVIEAAGAAHAVLVGRELVSGRAATPFELEHVAAQITDAAARAAGFGAAPPEHASAVEALRRAPGEDAAAWLARLDGLARLAAHGGTYRGASFDREDLWGVVDDLGCDVGVRAGAARVLAGLDPSADARARIEAAAAATHTVQDRMRFRAALEVDARRATELLAAAIADEVAAERRARVGGAEAEAAAEQEAEAEAERALVATQAPRRAEKLP